MSLQIHALMEDGTLVYLGTATDVSYQYCSGKTYEKLQNKFSFKLTLSIVREKKNKNLVRRLAARAIIYSALHS